MIAVCIATYNHETFIAQATESVQAQVCDEPIRIYIGDDASTDGTAAICARYAAEDERIVYIRREKNVGLVANTIDLYRRMMADGADYIAMLDGDDYWIDSHKLQVQKEYLRNHADVGLVHTAEQTQGDEAIPEGDLSETYDLGGARQTNCTVLFRAELLKKVDLDELEQQHFPVLDYPLYGIFSQYTKFGYLPVRTAVWRVHLSVSNPQRFRGQIAYKRERLRMWRWLDKKYSGRFHFRWYKAILWYIRQFFYILFA